MPIDDIMTFRAPKPWVLFEADTTITTFCDWQSNILFHLSLNNDFAPFIPDTFTWQKKSVQNRGLVNDVAPIPEAQRKTAIQKHMQLDVRNYSSILSASIMQRYSQKQYQPKMDLDMY